MDPSLSSTPTTETPNPISKLSHKLSQKYQHLLDKSTPFILHRWIGLSILALIYTVRVLILEGFYIVTYGLGIYVLQLLIMFLSPQVDPETVQVYEGGTLPVVANEEFRPFVRRLNEFKFWYSVTKGFCFAFVLTFFSAFDVPVFWPILFFYWVVLFVSTMKRQIMHMVKHKYVPFTVGKQRYAGKRVASSDDVTTTTV